MITRPPIYGLVAEFDKATDLVAAAEAAHRDGYRHGGKVDRSDPSQWVLNGRTTESNRQVSNPTILFTVTVQVFSVSFSVNPLNLPTTQKPLSRRRTWPRNQSP